MNIFNSLNYRTTLKFKLDERKQVKSNVTLEAMAIYCQIQKTYLSKVLNHGGNLNRDQLFLACEYLKLSEAETRFVFLVQEYDQCALEKRKQQLLKLIEQTQKEHLKTDAHLKTTKIEKIDFVTLADYYSDPFHQLIHIFLTIDRFQKKVGLIAEKLNISEQQLEKYLDNLEKFRIIERKSDGPKVLIDNLHLPANSPIIKAYRILSRTQVFQKIGQLQEPDDYSFNVVFSCDSATKKRIQQNFLEFLKQTQILVRDSTEQEVYQLGFDLIKWS